MLPQCSFFHKPYIHHVHLKSIANIHPNKSTLSFSHITFQEMRIHKLKWISSWGTIKCSLFTVGFIQVHNHLCHTCMHACTHTHTHTCIHIHRRTHTHTHKSHTDTNHSRVSSIKVHKRQDQNQQTLHVVFCPNSVLFMFCPNSVLFNLLCVRILF